MRYLAVGIAGQVEVFIRLVLEVIVYLRLDLVDLLPPLEFIL